MECFKWLQPVFAEQVKKFDQYRLADCILYPFNDHAPDLEECARYHYERWPDSLAGMYSLANGFQKKKNLRLLGEIIQQKYPSVSYDTTAMHLRIGDALTPGQLALHRKSKGVYTPVSHYLSKSRVDNDSSDITLVFGCHNRISLAMFKESEAYLSKAYSGLQALTSKPIKIRTTNPDDDFVFLVFSRYYVPSKSGWVRLISPLRSMLL